MYNAIKPTLLKLFSIDDKLPSQPLGANYKQVMIFKAAPAFLKYKLVGWMILTAFLGLLCLIMTAALFAAGEVPGMIVAIIMDMILLSVIFLSYFAIRIDYDMRTYIVTDKSLRIREGALLVREMTLTYENIQNVKVGQGPLERYFGISNLEVETAGGGGGSPQQAGSAFSFHTGYLRGIENAEEIGDLIRKRMEASHQDEQDPEPKAETLDELALYGEIRDEVKRLAKRIA